MNENQNEQIQAEDDSNQKWLIKVVFVLFGVIVFVGSWFLFREPIVDFLNGIDQQETESKIVIAYSEGFTSLNPLNYEVKNRQYLGNIYEGLTRFDKNLAVEPALAVSWGRLDDVTWEFTLRDFVYFHDGTALDSGDVVSSIERAMWDEDSQMKSLLSSIESVSAVDDMTVQVVTNGFDPILPNRLANVYIFPSEVSDLNSSIVGTGPYYAVSIGAGEMMLKKFPYYWGFSPVYDEVKLVYTGSADAENADVLVNVPIDSIPDREQAGYLIEAQPDLDVNFILFNSTDGAVFSDLELRKAFYMALDMSELIDGLGGYADVIHQFSAKGVNGYDSSIDGVDYDPDGAKTIFESRNVSKFTVYMVSDMEELGNFLTDQFSKIGVSVDVQYLDVASFQEGVVEQNFDVYFIGWKFDLGDSADLYETVFHTKTDSYGAYNGGYSNPEVDQLIEQASSEEDPGSRLSILKEISNKLVDDVAGVPLFEAKAVYGFKDGISWSPRVDAYLWVAELK